MKLCGRNEPCFEDGKNEWGHFGGVICKYADGNETCLKTKEPVLSYTHEQRYDELLAMLAEREKQNDGGKDGSK